MFRLFVIQGVTISRAPKNPDTETDLVSLKFDDQGLRVHPSEHAVKRKRQRGRYLHPSDDGFTSRRLRGEKRRSYTPSSRARAPSSRRTDRTTRSDIWGCFAQGERYRGFGDRYNRTSTGLFVYNLIWSISRLLGADTDGRSPPSDISEGRISVTDRLPQLTDAYPRCHQEQETSSRDRVEQLGQTDHRPFYLSVICLDATALQRETGIDMSNSSTFTIESLGNPLEIPPRLALRPRTDVVKPWSLFQ